MKLRLGRLIGGHILRIVLSIMVLGSVTACPFLNHSPVDEAAGGPAYWYNADRRQMVWSADNEVVLMLKAPLPEADLATLCRIVHPPAQVIVQWDHGVLLKTATVQSVNKLLDKMATTAAAGAIQSVGRAYYDTPARTPSSRRLLSHEIVVRYRPTITAAQRGALERRFQLKRLATPAHAPNTYIYSVSDMNQVLPLANQLYESEHTVYAYPNWIRSRAKK